MRALLPVLLALSFAGCVSGGAPVETAGVEQVDTAAQAQEAVAEAAVANESTEPTPATVPLAYSGNTGMGVCVFVVGACEAIVQGSQDEHVFDPVTGKPVHLVATFTYPDQKPGMSFFVGFCRGASAEEVACDDYQTGASPFAREFDLTADPEGTLYGFSVGSLNPATAAAGVMVFVDSPFEMAGELHVLR